MSGKTASTPLLTMEVRGPHRIDLLLEHLLYRAPDFGLGRFRGNFWKEIATAGYGPRVVSTAGRGTSEKADVEEIFLSCARRGANDLLPTPCPLILFLVV